MKLNIDPSLLTTKGSFQYEIVATVSVISQSEESGDLMFFVGSSLTTSIVSCLDKTHLILCPHSLGPTTLPYKYILEKKKKN